MHGENMKLSYFIVWLFLNCTGYVALIIRGKSWSGGQD